MDEAGRGEAGKSGDERGVVRSPYFAAKRAQGGTMLSIIF
jgi:hypothetical protein